MSIENKLTELGIVLPSAAIPVANYCSFKIIGSVIYVSGQLPMGPEGLDYAGKVGSDLTVSDAKKAARLAGLNIIAQLKLAAGGQLDAINDIVRLGGFVNCIDGFGDQPQIINAASDLMVDVFGDKGRHARAAVGVNALPMNASVEIDAIATLKE